MQNKFKMSGFALSLYGALTLIPILAFYPYFSKYVTSLSQFCWFQIGLMNLVMIVSFLSLLSGVFLLKNNAAAHRFAFPISVVLLLSFPFGTIAGAIYLWQRHEFAN